VSQTYALSLHDALPISWSRYSKKWAWKTALRLLHELLVPCREVAAINEQPLTGVYVITTMFAARTTRVSHHQWPSVTGSSSHVRSEEHTSELQSRENLV